MNIVDIVCDLIVIIGLLVDIHENHKIMKFDNQICDTFYKSIDALDRKTTAQDNFIWTSVMMTARRVSKLEHKK